MENPRFIGWYKIDTINYQAFKKHLQKRLRVGSENKKIVY